MDGCSTGCSTAWRGWAVRSSSCCWPARCALCFGGAHPLDQLRQVPPTPVSAAQASGLSLNGAAVLLGVHGLPNGCHLHSRMPCRWRLRRRAACTVTSASRTAAACGSACRAASRASHALRHAAAASPHSWPATDGAVAGWLAAAASAASAAASCPCWQRRLPPLLPPLLKLSVRRPLQVPCQILWRPCSGHGGESGGQRSRRAAARCRLCLPERWSGRHSSQLGCSVADEFAAFP